MLYPSKWLTRRILYSQTQNNSGVDFINNAKRPCSMFVSHRRELFAKSVIWPATATELLIKKNTGLLIAEEGVNGKRKDQFFGVTHKCWRREAVTCEMQVRFIICKWFETNIEIDKSSFVACHLNKCYNWSIKQKQRHAARKLQNNDSKKEWAEWEASLGDERKKRRSKF